MEIFLLIFALFISLVVYEAIIASRNAFLRLPVMSDEAFQKLLSFISNFNCNERYKLLKGTFVKQRINFEQLKIICNRCPTHVIKDSFGKDININHYYVFYNKFYGDHLAIEAAQNIVKP